MQLRHLGKTDIEITPIGLGCWQFAQGKTVGGQFWPSLDDETTDAIVQESIGGGINWFDSAEAYGRGRSEAGLSRALKRAGKANGEVVVATKWFPMGRTAGNIPKNVEVRLGFLDGYAIDLFQVHWHIGCLSSYAAQMEAMAGLVEQKKIRSVGISNFKAKGMRTCHAALQRRGVPLASNQVRYSILDRRIEGNGVLEAAKELGVTIIAYSPLAQGLATGKFHDDPKLIKRRVGPRKWMSGFRGRGLEKSRPVIDALREIAARHQASPSQVGLNWLASFHGETVVVIPGATKVKQAQDNVGALGFTLSSDELTRLDEVSRPFIG